jgi:DNA repair exonuclease SbcCD nuclease subunit
MKQLRSMKERDNSEMLIAVINDTHFGARQDSEALLHIQEKFYQNVFFKTLKENNIKTLLHLGDLFDRRKNINFVTLHRTKKMFLDVLRDMDIQMHIVPGNHDTFYRTTNEINSLDLLLKEYDNINIYWNYPKKLTFGSSKILLCPWLTNDNQLHSLKEISETDADILAGHFTFKGFEVSRGSFSTYGLEMENFSKFDMIWSGHFHIPSKKGNVEYLGAPYEMDWGDHNGVRGFHIFDTESREIERVVNPYQLHHIINYDDSGMSLEDVEDLDVSDLSGCFVRINVKKRTNMNLYDIFLKKIENAGVTDLKVVDDILTSTKTDFSIETVEVKNTREVIHEYLDRIETKAKLENVKYMADDLYREAIRLSN